MAFDPFTNQRRQLRRFLAAPPASSFHTLSAVGVYRPALGGIMAVYNAPWSTPYYLVRLASKCMTSTGKRLVSPITLYAGTIPSDHAQITTWPDGSKADYSPPRPPEIPGGVALLVVWETSSPDAPTAYATCSVEFTRRL